LIRTNNTWSPRFRSKGTPGQTREEKQEHIRHNGVLTARWKYINTFDNKAIDNTRQEQLLALGKEECFPLTEFVLPKSLRFDWRGPTSCGGSENGKYSYADLCEHPHDVLLLRP
jgi:DNA (cytosine-5)-methyltransferase 1